MDSSPGVNLATFAHIMNEFFLSLSFLPVESAMYKACVHSGKEVADTLPAIEISVSTQYIPHKDGNGRPQGEEPCDVTTVQMFRQDARRGKAPFELWK